MGIAVLSADYSGHIAIKHTHYHDYNQLLFVTGGTACVCVNNTTYHVSAGDLIIFSHLEHHSVTEQSQDYRRYILELAPDLPAPSKDVCRVLSILFNRPAGFRHVLDVRDAQSEFQQMFEAIRQEYTCKRPLFPDMLDALVRQLLIAVYRHAPDIFGSIEEDSLELVYQVQMLFHREFQQKFILRDLADSYNISVSYLSHLFKSATGTSVMGYLQSCRIAEAKKCLAETDMRIGEIVEHCGFSDSSNFSRTFRSVTGFSPSDFREQLRKSAE